MNDYKLLMSPVFWVGIAVIIILHILAAFFEGSKSRAALAILIINIAAHLVLCFYMLYLRASVDELLLALLISVGANLSSRSIRKRGDKDGI